MDNIYTEKLQRLLTEPLYSSWNVVEKRSFLALANVGLFYASNQPALVPDVMLSLDVPAFADRVEQDNRSYFSWIFGKMPEVVIEIVSDRRGGEDGEKMRSYNRLNIPYYVIFDPRQCLDGGLLRAFEQRGSKYEPIDARLFAEVGLGLKLWQGVYEEDTAQWLRWCDAAGVLIPTGRERAEQEKQRAEQEKQRAEAAEEKNRRLIERLRSLVRWLIEAGIA